MNELTILRVATVAANWHSTQRRKGANKEPYIEHSLEVAHLVPEADPGNSDLILAALLHDAIEDQQKTREDVAELFGDYVASVVTEFTDDKSLPKPERKRLQIETASKKSRDAKLIKIADKISNPRSIAKSPPPHWSDQPRREYVD